MKDAAFVSAVGNHLRKQILTQTDVPGDRVFVTCMGVDVPQLAVLGQNRSRAPGTLNLITVARLHPAKGHFHALAAIHRALGAGINVHYVIVGEGTYRDAIAAKVRELGLEDRVTMMGTLSELEILKKLSEADTLLLPSTGLGEAWPVSVMEAMGADFRS